MAGSRGLLLLAFAGLMWKAPVAVPAESASVPVSGRGVFLGDSITYSGAYVVYLEAFLRTRYPGQDFQLINLGLPSETVSGLSEPGHAGGRFPRPDLHERLDRVLLMTDPDWIVACYGMNDGIYYPLGEDRFARFRQGILRLREKATAAGVSVLHLTPPTFDPVPIQDRTLPAGRDEYRQPFEGYNRVLGVYSDWLLDQRLRGWRVVDVHGPMDWHLACMRFYDTQYKLAGDGVHANATGHWLITEQLLEHWNVPGDVDVAEVDVQSKTVVLGDVTAMEVGEKEISFEWKTRIPMPRDMNWDAAAVAFQRVHARFNRHRLVVRGLASGEYALFDDRTLLRIFEANELGRGVDLLEFPNLSSNRGGPELLKLISARQRMLSDAWLTEIRHERPGMKQGKPVEEAMALAGEQVKKIQSLAAPVTLKLRLVRMK